MFYFVLLFYRLILFIELLNIYRLQNLYKSINVSYARLALLNPFYSGLYEDTIVLSRDEN